MRHFLNTAFKGREQTDTVEVYPVNYYKQEEKKEGSPNDTGTNRKEDVTDRLQEYLSENVFQIEAEFMVPVEDDKEDPIPKFVKQYIGLDNK
jgi:hypothetical protein